MEEIGAQCFAGCARIPDFYQARERLYQLAKARLTRWIRLLLCDRVATVIEQGRNLKKRGIEAPEIAAENLAFRERHQHRVRDGAYRKKGWFIGHGVVEAGHKNLVGNRFEQS